MMNFEGKRVLVTGSSRGIGRAAARVLHDLGARVAVNGRSAGSTANGIAALGGGSRLMPAPGDIATVKGCEEVVRSAVEKLGGLDVLVNSAGVGDARPLLDCDEAMWDQILNVNLKGTFFCIRAAYPHLKASRGNVVNVASDAGLIGEKKLSVYCASKGGVVNVTRALALELAPDVRVNCVCPGYVDTDMVRRDMIEKAADPALAEAEVMAYAPLKRMARPEEIGKTIAYLASDDAGFITGAAFAIDGGSTAGHS
jgi:NAD(P)-dependent dehydrogenase (short-subunit alcohol dehydrogenase family)